MNELLTHKKQMSYDSRDLLWCLVMKQRVVMIKLMATRLDVWLVPWPPVAQNPTPYRREAVELDHF